MQIDIHTKVAAVLDAYPHLEACLIDLSPVFSKLQNPVLRRSVARVASLEQAAKIAGLSPAFLVQRLRQEAGLAPLETCECQFENVEIESRPDWFEEARVTIRFDAGPIIESGSSPMQQILYQAETLPEGTILELSAPFKPVPIIDLLRQQAFSVWHSDGKTYVYRKPAKS